MTAISILIEKNAPKSGICCMCGDTSGIMHVATNNDRWVIWRPAYKTELRRFLCIKCANTYRPSLSLSLEKGDKEALRMFPIFDDNGNMLPHITQKHIEAFPLTYPIRYLGDLHITANWVDLVKVTDCSVMTLIPDKGQEYYMDRFLERDGYIFTCIPKWWDLTQFRLPIFVQFICYFDSHDKKQVTLNYSNGKPFTPQAKNGLLLT